MAYAENITFTTYSSHFLFSVFSLPNPDHVKKQKFYYI